MKCENRNYCSKPPSLSQRGCIYRLYFSWTRPTYEKSAIKWSVPSLQSRPHASLLSFQVGSDAPARTQWAVTKTLRVPLTILGVTWGVGPTFKCYKQWYHRNQKVDPTKTNQTTGRGTHDHEGRGKTTQSFGCATQTANSKTVEQRRGETLLKEY